MKKEKAAEAAREKALREESLKAEQAQRLQAVVKEEPMEVVGNTEQPKETIDSTGTVVAQAVQELPVTGDPPIPDGPAGVPDTHNAVVVSQPLAVAEAPSEPTGPVLNPDP